MPSDSYSEYINMAEYSVSEVSLAIRKTVEANFGMVKIRGEVGRISKPASGHIYLDLKDERSVLSGVIWKGTFQKLDTLPEEGLEVVVTGRITTFQGQSKYQVIIEKVEHAGIGALMALLEKRKKLLLEEGIFDREKKSPIPYIPNKIGVITSESGAVIQDILQRLGERFPVEVVLWPVAVQGKASASEISEAINGFNELSVSEIDMRPDVIIVARGGGSIEDLWSFNEEIVVRAVYESKIPVISAIGHETDNTLIDLVSDLRAPTPSAAAELVVPVRSELISTIVDLDNRRQKAETKIMNSKLDILRELSKRISKNESVLYFPRQIVDEFIYRLAQSIKLSQTTKILELKSLGIEKLNFSLLEQSLFAKKETLVGLSLRFHSCMKNEKIRLRDGLHTLSRILESLSYKKTLKRGYSLVLNNDGKIINSKKTALLQDHLTIEFNDGKVDVKIR